MAQSLATEDEGVRQPCFTKSAEEPGGRGGVCPQAQKRLRSNMDTRSSVKLGPSPAFPGGHVPPLWGWHGTSTLKGEEQKLNKLLSGL